MRYVAILTLLLGLMACSSNRQVLVRPELDMPTRPKMLTVNWTHADNGLHSLDDENARNLLINLERKDTFIDVLEGYLEAAGGNKEARR